MKKIKFYMMILAATAAGFALTSCDDDFMNEIPQTSITIPGYFNSVNDLETYANGLYESFPYGIMHDADSDNVTGAGNTDGMATELWQLVNGQLSKYNVNGWDKWKKLRSANVFLDNVGRAKGNEADIKHWTGFVRLLRAVLYIDMVQRYSDVPWMEHAIASDDDDVARPSDPRTFVVDKIMEDLEYACANLSENIGNRTNINKYCALAMLSRFALYEGTFRKYHAELGLQTQADEFGHSVASFLERSVQASEQIMGSGHFEIAARSVNEPSPGIYGSPAYRDLFCSFDLGSNKEIIRWIEYKPTENINFNRGAVHVGTFGLSRSLMESYLNSDGTAFSTRRGYATLPYYDGFVNRDPRLAENFAHPGSSERKPNYVKYPNEPVKGGYCQEKYESNRSNLYNDCYEGLILYRYAEVVLNFAEAKAELGQFGTADADKSINKLRNRVGMPAFDASREVDQTLRDQYPNVTDPAILAIRRERRVELACEGLRLQDVYRWAAGERFRDPASQQGMWVPALGTYDVSGDGIPDYAIVQKQSDIPENWASSGLIQWYYLEANPSPDLKRGAWAELFMLSEGTRGYIVYRDQTYRDFINPRDYYRPINTYQMVLNKNLKQQKYWDN